VTFNYSKAVSYLDNFEYEFTTGLYFTGTDTTITCTDNNYYNHYLNLRGAIFQLDTVTFSDTSSTYTNNTALYGGVISCTKCTMTLTGNTFSYNMGN
jgi:hypothetical protein